MRNKFLNLSVPWLMALLGGVMIFGIAQTPAMAQEKKKGNAPRPALVSRSWQLDFKFEKPQPIAIYDLNGRIQWFWYMAYEVKNKTGRDQLFIPSFDLVNDEGQMIQIGRDVPARVFHAVKKRQANRLLKSPSQIVGKLLQGDDYAKSGVAIWPLAKKQADQITIFIAGLSGETATIKRKKTGKTIVLRKTLMIKYSTPGENVHPQDQEFIARGRKWVMR